MSEEWEPSAESRRADLIPLGQVVREYGIAASVVQRWLADGRLPTVSIKGVVHIDRKHLDDIVVRPPTDEPEPTTCPDPPDC